MVTNHDDAVFDHHPTTTRGFTETVNWALKHAGKSAQYRLCSVQGITKFSLLTSRMSYASLASIMASATPAANFRFQNVQASDKYIHSGFFYHPMGPTR